MVQLNVYKNNDSTSEQYGKAYARVDYKETLGIQQLAKLMAEHNTGFSPGNIEGILVDAVKTIREQTLMGNCVKIDNLAIFKCSVQANATNRYGIMKAKIGAKTTKVNGVITPTGNAIKRRHHAYRQRHQEHEAAGRGHRRVHQGRAEQRRYPWLDEEGSGAD